MPKRRDGFQGEKLISLPDSVWKNAIEVNPMLSQLYLTHIGYFPNAYNHYRDRRKGCTDYILIYCLRGKGWYSINGKKFPVAVNQFFIIPPTKEHIMYGADETDPWTIYWVHFSSQQTDLLNRCFKTDLYDGPQNILFNEKGIQLWDEMYNDLEMGYSFENLARTNLCLYNFIATFIFPDKQVDENKQDAKMMIDKTILLMRNKISEKLTIEELATINNLSTSHFTFLFRKSTGMSPIDYFIHLKLQKACLLLHTTDVRIKNVADMLGYDDPCYFSRLFKKYMNISPEQYRFLGRKEDSDTSKKTYLETKTGSGRTVQMGDLVF